jgi:hypothetical protein
VKNSLEGGVAYVIPIEPDATTVLDDFINGQPFPPET